MATTWCTKWKLQPPKVVAHLNVVLMFIILQMGLRGLYKPLRYMAYYDIEEALDNAIEREKGSAAKLLLKGAGLGIGVFLAEETIDLYVHKHGEQISSAFSPVKELLPYEIKRSAAQFGSEIYSVFQKIPYTLTALADNPLGSFALGVATTGLIVYAIKKRKKRHAGSRI